MINVYFFIILQKQLNLLFQVKYSYGKKLKIVYTGLVAISRDFTKMFT